MFQKRPNRNPGTPENWLFTSLTLSKTGVSRNIGEFFDSFDFLNEQKSGSKILAKALVETHFDWEFGILNHFLNVNKRICR